MCYFVIIYKMMFSKSFLRKSNQLRKQKWSAPAVMGAFIVISMILVLSFETLGIANKEGNLDYRIVTPERGKMIKVINNSYKNNQT